MRHGSSQARPPVEIVSEAAAFRIHQGRKRGEAGFDHIKALRGEPEHIDADIHALRVAGKPAMVVAVELKGALADVRMLSLRSTWRCAISAKTVP